MGLGRWFRRKREEVVVDQVSKAVIAGLARHIVTALAGAGVMVSDDLVTQCLSGLVGIAAAWWSARQKKASISPAI